MTDCGCQFEAQNAAQRQTLKIVLAINALMFAVEALSGWLAGSAGLLADSLDMLADASVYAISLYAVGRSARLGLRAATASGFLQVALGISLLVESVRRFVAGGEPLGFIMIATGCLALLANVICLKLISRHKDGDISFRASYIFSANDVIANLGVMVGGGLVGLTGTQWPDLLVAVLIGTVVVRGGLKILADAREQNANAHDCSRDS